MMIAYYYIIMALNIMGNYVEKYDKLEMMKLQLNKNVDNNQT